MMDFANKNVLVVGVGISGNAAAETVKKLGFQGGAERFQTGKGFEI